MLEANMELTQYIPNPHKPRYTTSLRHEVQSALIHFLIKLNLKADFFWDKEGELYRRYNK